MFFPEEQKQVEEKLRQLLEKRREILFAYLFGSFARGTAGNLSDVDVAIFLDKGQIPGSGPYGYKSEMMVTLRQYTGKDVDLVILNDASTLLRFQVIKDGKLLLCRSEGDRLRFHEKSLREYLDFKPFFDVQRYYLKKRLAEGTFGGGEVGGH